MRGGIMPSSIDCYWRFSFFRFDGTGWRLWLPQWSPHWAFLYYFQEPVGSLKATDPQSYVAVAGFLLTAIIVSQTALKARRRAAEALERKRETERLYELAQARLESDRLQPTIGIAINKAIP